jgi:hypothetical protein
MLLFPLARAGWLALLSRLRSNRWRFPRFLPPNITGRLLHFALLELISLRNPWDDRFQVWAEAGVFLTLWQAGVKQLDDLCGIDWDWLAMDGALTKAPLGGEIRLFP